MPDSKFLLVAQGESARASKLVIIDLNGNLVERVHIDRRINTDITGMDVRADGNVALISSMEPGPFTTPAELFEVNLSSGVTANLTRTPELSEEWPHYLNENRVLFTGGLLTTDVGSPDGWVQLPPPFGQISHFLGRREF